ncbi:MAG: hypothetical protein NWQ27_02010 [Crocinitomicaceae bacterium]|jgi:hypothetical protein|nr:hypothetical protein [Crocinitomicaceae bacterium]
MEKDKQRAEIVDLLLNKSAMKQDIADYSEKVLDSFKDIAKQELDILSESVDDNRVRLRFKDNGKYEFRLFVGSDALVLQLHTNVFRLPDENPLWKTNYLTENGANGYFAIINIYNFLAESFEKNRFGDAGYLIGRIFINHEGHFMVEGKGQLGFLFRNLQEDVISDDNIRHIIQCSMAYAIEFDLITPPYEMIQEVNIMQINAISSDLKVATGKRLGFKFKGDDNNIF